MRNSIKMKYQSILWRVINNKLPPRFCYIFIQLFNYFIFTTISILSLVIVRFGGRHIFKMDERKDVGATDDVQVKTYHIDNAKAIEIEAEQQVDAKNTNFGCIE